MLGRFALGYSLFLVSGFLILASPALAQTSADWYTAGANPQRTGWVSEEVFGSFSLKWYRPIEAYIDRKTQIIPAYLSGRGVDALFVTTARGIYALNASTGETIWRFDTELPVAHTPTVINGQVYFSSLDRTVKALDAETGSLRWSFCCGGAGFYVNPLVADNRVLVGNRDGYFYALNANTGAKLWQFPRDGQAPLGPIIMSAAYDAGVAYFVSDDMHAYAVNAADGTQVWQSPKLTGERFHSYWPVIYKNNGVEDMVVIPGSAGYKTSSNPGTLSAGDGDYVDGVQRNDVCSGISGNLGPTNNSGAWGWPPGITVMDASRVLEYLEEPNTGDTGNPNSRTVHKPWRQITTYLRKSNGSLYTFDSDGDGYQERPPNLYYGSSSGSVYPPIVNPNDHAIYQNNVYSCSFSSASRGRVMGWKPTQPRYLRWQGGDSADDEPQGISFGGTALYRILDGHKADVTNDSGTRPIWSNPGLFSLIPNYSVMWRLLPASYHDLHGQYKGTSDSWNGIYHESGNREAFVPYRGKIYVHKGNYALSFGPGTAENRSVAPLTITTKTDSIPVPPTTELKRKLEGEIQKLLSASNWQNHEFLKPGIYNDGYYMSRTGLYSGMQFYFTIPGETLLTLIQAYPLLDGNLPLQQQLQSYIRNFYQTYYVTAMPTQIGWNRGVSREFMNHPPEVVTSMQSLADSTGPIDNRITPILPYPQINLYAMWQYAQLFPAEAPAVYARAKTKLLVPSGISETGSTVPSHEFHPWRVNDAIAGYVGYLNLQQLAGTDTDRRTEVQAELNRLQDMRSRLFSKDSPWSNDEFWTYNTRFNISRNFLWLVPELGQYLHDHALAHVQTAVSEYNYVGPYWFVSAYEASMAEGLQASLYDVPAIFQAKAYILKQPREELYKYLDVPIFKAGDLFYIQNLMATIKAPSDPNYTPPPPSPSPTPFLGFDGDGDVDWLDLSLLVSRFNQTYLPYNLLGTGLIDIFDFNFLVQYL